MKNKNLDEGINLTIRLIERNLETDVSTKVYFWSQCYHRI
jgi:hypothetical protein